MRHKGRRRTLFSLVGALGLAASVFLYFQLFSVEMIDFHKRKSEQLKYSKENLHLTLNKDNLIQEKIDANLGQHSLRDGKKWKKQYSDDCDSPDCDDMEQQLKPGNKLVKNHMISNKSSLLSKESFTLNIIKNLPQGAKRELAALYRPSNQNTFTCIHSKEVIAFDWVNDDYCDCADGSDEPGTSACVNNVFYCTFQGGERKYIPSGHVNDGICDCCDGSDEWKKKLLPDQVKIDDKPHYGYYQAPCINHCEQELIHAQELASIHQQGEALKKKYIEAGRGESNPNQLYGPNGEFLTLSKNCYDIKSDKYEYKVCPFKEIHQQMFPEPATLIGQVPEWTEKGEKGHWTLKMSQGDSKQCPGSTKRFTFIIFECGLKDEILSIHETEVCQYTVHFSTPAAC